ncbi:unnamed protein product [Cyprideis torosa]|uniref:1,4-alpha-glucan branching enzyme n=1 Tax=Cyprideis torosa TaxID=163714 RepID=A0A7R8WNU4_9CRUS|nr:unnamed protein product [Cyprideis torosa]CAG0906617.1 unnamed protein product [Cyprideis torosa]
MESSSLNLSQDQLRLINGHHHDPFCILGAHPSAAGETLVTVFAPEAESLQFEHNEAVLIRIEGTDLFQWRGDESYLPRPYSLSVVYKGGGSGSFYDPYCFGPQIPDFDLELFGGGQHLHMFNFLGANPRIIDGIEGVLFATWAPNARRVSVIGEFNGWDGRRHAMRSRGGSGVWELFIPGIAEGSIYKFEIMNTHTGDVLEKTDPYGRQFELRPNTASMICADSAHLWGDGEWLSKRQVCDWQAAPMSIYELHLGSWMRGEANEFLNYRDLAHQLVDYLLPLNFTHIELLPITEHPLDDSWGYQVTGYYAPTSRFGSPDDFRYFMDYLHKHEIGVILDWVPAHFPKDVWSLSNFDGTPLYEHADPRKGEHTDWGTKIFNLSRNEVKNFLLASAMFWIEEFHIDGIRMDAVASMLYLDYSREEGQWVPNEYGGRENLEAIDFIRHLNHEVGRFHPGVMMIAEESTSWPQVSRPPESGGLGFNMKWNMGWMHDTLVYMGNEPIHRRYHHSQLTFGMLYCFSENFVLPFSHDEVVHGKGSLMARMPGDRWQQFANLRLLFTYQMTYPGKKLLFMGCEFGQFGEWNHHQSIDWSYLQFDEHRGVQQSLADLNRLYRDQTALHGLDFASEGFAWLDCNDEAQSIIAYMRRCGDEFVVVVLNFTPVPRDDYRVPVPVGGAYSEIFNSDSVFYGGSNLGNAQLIQSDPNGFNGHEHSIVLNLPPLAGVILKVV